MSQVLINESTLQNTANAIRSKTKRETGLADNLNFSLEVLGKYYNYTKSGSGSLWVEIIPELDWPGINMSYFYIEDYSNTAVQYPVGDKVCSMTNSNGAVKIVPFQKAQGKRYYVISKSITSSTRISLYLFPLDENMNPIVYDENIHSNMPHRNLSIEYMLKPQNMSLFYPSDFSSAIGTTTGSSVLKFLSSPIDIGTTYGYSHGNVPGMDLRYYGVNQIQDIKYFQFQPYNYYPFCIIPSWSWTRVDPPTGFEQFGYGYRIFQTQPGSSTPWPYYSGSQALYLKDGRLYGVKNSGYRYYDMNGFSNEKWKLQQILVV